MLYYNRQAKMFKFDFRLANDSNLNNKSVLYGSQNGFFEGIFIMA